MKKHVHVIGAGGIGISALARRYLAEGWRVTGTNDCASEILDALSAEGVETAVGEKPEWITRDTAMVVYTSAIIRNGSSEKHPELAFAERLGVPALSYPRALAKLTEGKRLVAVAGSHGKSTTTAMLGLVLKECSDGSTVVGTQVPQFGNRNCWWGRGSEMAIEACEYRRSFLAYRPEISVITNIDLDHLDYYRDFEDYLSAFQQLVDQTSGTVVVDGRDPACRRLNPGAKRLVEVWPGRATFNGVARTLRKLSLKVPGDHLAFDAYLAYAAALCLGLPEDGIVSALESYSGSWRRSEVVKETANGNILMSDYGHHPTEIAATLGAIAEKYAGRKLVACFQPHQYSRTRELLDGFASCFGAAATVVVPDIYFSRDSDEDVAAMPVSRFLAELRRHHADVRGGEGLEKAAETLRALDAENPGKLVIVLQGAGNVDDLRHKF